MRNIKKVHSLRACKPCTAIPTHASKVMCGHPQLHENTNLERILFWLHLVQWNVFVPYEIHMIKYSHAPSHKIRSFLLKTDQGEDGDDHNFEVYILDQQQWSTMPNYNVVVEDDEDVWEKDEGGNFTHILLVCFFSFLVEV